MMFATACLLSVPSSSFFAYAGDALLQRGNLFGRELVVALLVVLSTIFFSLQALPSVFKLDANSSLALVFCIRVLYGIVRAPITQILDSIALQHVSSLGKDSEVTYGSERAWGAISWAVLSIITGICIDASSVLVMYFLTVLMSVPILVALYWSSREKSQSNVSNINSYRPVAKDDTEDNCDSDTATISATSSGVLDEASEKTLLEKVPDLLTNYFNSLPKAAFLVCIIVLNAGMSIVENLLFIFFTETLHASSLLCGLTVVVTVVFEVPLFQYSHLLKQYLGRTGLISVAMIAYGTRVFGYTFVPNGWWVLLLEPLHGVTYGCAQLAAVDFASEFCPPGLEATSQTLMGILRYGIGYVIGNAIAGVVEERFGPNTLYRGAGLSVLLSLLVYRIIVRLTPEISPNGEMKLNSESN